MKTDYVFILLSAHALCAAQQNKNENRIHVCDFSTRLFQDSPKDFILNQTKSIVKRFVIHTVIIFPQLVGKSYQKSYSDDDFKQILQPCAKSHDITSHFFSRLNCFNLVFDTVTNYQILVEL